MIFCRKGAQKERSVLVGRDKIESVLRNNVKGKQNKIKKLSHFDLQKAKRNIISPMFELLFILILVVQMVSVCHCH